jgi:hypothetical protein
MSVRLTFAMFPLFALSALLLGCSLHSNAAPGGVPAGFRTQAEAEAAAPRFGCKGAHRMGQIWMPCSSHGDAPGGGGPKGGGTAGAGAVNP